MMLSSSPTISPTSTTRVSGFRGVQTVQSNRLTIAVIFGGRSVEHGVSVITAWQVLAAIDRARYEILPLYLTGAGGECFLISPDFTVRDHPGLPLDATTFERSARHAGRRILLAATGAGSLVRELRSMPFVGDALRPLRVDVALPLIHGTHGEDGTIQGLFELADVAYVGPGVVGSAVCMDKIATKAVLKGSGFPVVESARVDRWEWREQRKETLDGLERLGMPLFVKPANLGSSIAVSRAEDREQLGFAVDVALHYDRKCLVEKSVEGAWDINCAVLGTRPPLVSVCERPLSSRDFLSYEDKYLRGGKQGGLSASSRQIPAQIPEEVAKRLQDLALQAFRATDCGGVARVDFLVQPETWTVYVNEINTIPGSLSFYLWEASGLPGTDVLDRLVASAQERQREKQLTIYSAQDTLALIR